MNIDKLVMPGRTIFETLAEIAIVKDMPIEDDFLSSLRWLDFNRSKRNYRTFSASLRRRQ
jgi:hypothetical protein